MYGLVNKAIQELVCAKFGLDAWERIKAKAGVDIDLFISHESYEDGITYRLVGAATEILGVDGAIVLETFGEHWVTVTAEQGYGELMSASGDSLSEFLLNLPNFHARVKLLFPNLHPPTFKVSDVTESTLHLHYYSHRPGLAPFVIGLMRGLGQRFNTPVATTLLSSREQGLDHDTFLVSWEASRP
jgi:hypothetical protein